ncbi:hypothetical protein [Formosa haliotis]|uniref:hypothetical protein n=1 Tax=Formosa haliotis TaxID=1555194 RepID=UPI000824018E|nr:hypothetical protein [Formosa haliotis]
MKLLKPLLILLIISVSTSTTAQDFKDEQHSGYYMGEYTRSILYHIEFKNDRNLNTGGKNYDESKGIIATNTIWHDKAHPSAIYLPVVNHRQ